MKMERKMRINVWASRGIEEDEYSYQADDFRITDGDKVIEAYLGAGHKAHG